MGLLEETGLRVQESSLTGESEPAALGEEDLPLGERADMVLTDDNFATIVAAVEQGRVIYDNIRKFIKYLLTSNSAEILVMLVGPFLGMPLPLLPLQILWINLVTDRLRQGHGATTSWRWRPSRRNFDREPVGIYLTAPHPE